MNERHRAEGEDVKFSISTLVMAAYRTVFGRPLLLIEAMPFGLIPLVLLWIILLSWDGFHLFFPGWLRELLFLLPYLYFGLIW